MIAIPTLCLMAAGMGGCNYVRVNPDQVSWGLIWREETVLEDELTSRRIQCTAFDNLEKDRFDDMWKRVHLLDCGLGTGVCHVQSVLEKCTERLFCRGRHVPSPHLCRIGVGYL
jgi:hypothetical protein